jgi:hypothetical protein
MMRPLASLCALLALLVALPLHADAELDSFAREVERTEGIRAVKRLQSSYAQYAQYGLWNEVGALFARDGSFIFDGSVRQAQTSRGPAAIAGFLRARYGGNQDGPAADGLSAMMIDSPVVHLSVDGGTARARWQAMIFHGHGGNSRKYRHPSPPAFPGSGRGCLRSQSR